MKRVSAARKAAVRAGAMLAAGLLMAATLPASPAEEGRDAEMKTLSAGDPAPDFSMPGSDGKTHSLADYKGKQAVVLAWFPKAFTGG